MGLIKRFSGEVCYLELNRPEKRNALSKSVVIELTRFFRESHDSNQFKVLVISGNGGFFSAGADLEWMKSGMSQSESENLEDAQLFNKLYSTMYNYPKPLIVKVDKGAYGGAIGLMACADIVTTTADAEFQFSEPMLGLVPATIAPYIMRRIGLTMTKQLFLTAMKFDGNEAFNYRLVNYLFSEEQLAIKTRELASTIIMNSPSALKETKLLLNRLGNYIVPISEEEEQHCAGIIARARRSADGQEGVKAFFEKRKPEWNDL
ncbi:MAG: methylglutaconyl-CoA hydratase [Bacteroidales bacterium]|nr:methylglutaconyl-CoA hydratase [Bacteroidales bacterium]